MELRRDRPLYDKLQSFQIVNDSNESVEVNLVFRILSGYQPSPIPGQTEALFHFELTDERDPYFLYYFMITEQDFPVYKREQEILVDYSVFPLKIIELLELCVQKPSRGSASSDSSYMAKLNLKSSKLSIYESNNFKQIKHIELPLRQGDDNAIKMYLASRLSLALEILKQNSMRITSLQEQLEDETSLKLKIEKDLYEYQTTRNADFQTLKANHAQELNEQRKESIQNMEAMKLKFTTEIDELKLTIDELKLAASNQKTQLESQITELLQAKNSLELQLRDTTRLHKNVEKDRDRLLGETEDYLTKLRSNEEEKTSLQHSIIKLQSKNDNLLQQLHDREENLQKTLELNRSFEENKHNLELRIDGIEKQYSDLNNNYSLLQEEYNNSLQLVEKLQIEIRNLKENIRVKNEVIKKQEIIVTEIKQKTVDYEGLYKQEQEKTAERDKDIKELRKHLKEFSRRYKEAEDQLNKKQAMIELLSRESVNRQGGFPDSSMNQSHADYSSALPISPTNQNKRMNFQSLQASPPTRTAPNSMGNLPGKYHLATSFADLPPTEEKPFSQLHKGLQTLGLSEKEMLFKLDDLQESYEGKPDERQFSSRPQISSLPTSAAKYSSRQRTGVKEDVLLGSSAKELSLENIDFYAIKK